MEEKIPDILAGNKEKIKPRIEILTLDKFLDIIYKGSSFPQDNRFLPVEKGGVFKYLSLSSLTGLGMLSFKGSFFVAYDVNKIVGIAKLEQNQLDDHNFALKFISVDPLYQSEGYASRLLTHIFQFAKDNGYTLHISTYSDQGKEKLKSVVERLSQEMGIKFSIEGQIDR